MMDTIKKNVLADVQETHTKLVVPPTAILENREQNPDQSSKVEAVDLRSGSIAVLSAALLAACGGGGGSGGSSAVGSGTGTPPAPTAGVEVNPNPSPSPAPIVTVPTAPGFATKSVPPARRCRLLGCY